MVLDYLQMLNLHLMQGIEKFLYWKVTIHGMKMFSLLVHLMLKKFLLKDGDW